MEASGGHKGPPSPSQPPSPLRNPGLASSVDAYLVPLAWQESLGALCHPELSHRHTSQYVDRLEARR
jgi:hypothetical protein